MQSCEQLLQEINKVRNELIQKKYTIEHLSDPELVRISQKLDVLISIYQSKTFNPQ